MTELNFIDFKCPHCGEMASFPDTHAGLPQECPNCSETVIVPADGSALGRPLPLPIPTARLVLRRLHVPDWKDLLEVMSDEALFEYVESQPLDEEQILRWLEADSHVRLTTPNQPFHLGLQTRDGEKLIGYVSLRLAEAHPLGTISIIVGRPHQRRGYATEALKAVLDFCFNGIGLHRVSGSCDSRHAAACRLMEKTGLQREGEFRRDRLFNGEWANTAWFGILQEEFAR